MPLIRSERQRPHAISNDYVVYLGENIDEINDVIEPLTYDDVICGLQSTQWLNAIRDEMQSMVNNKV